MHAQIDAQRRVTRDARKGTRLHTRAPRRTSRQAPLRRAFARMAADKNASRIVLVQSPHRNPRKLRDLVHAVGSSERVHAPSVTPHAA